MNKQRVRSVIRKDINNLITSPKTYIPMIIVSVLLCIILPFALSYGGTHTNAFDVRNYPELEKIIQSLVASLPDGQLKINLEALDRMGMKFTYFVVNFVLISIFLMVTIINSMVTSVNSLVGEKERGTMETLLFSPITMKELFFAKVCSSFIPSVFLTYATYVVSFAVLNLTNYPKFQYLLMLSDIWLVLLFFVVPMIVLFNVLLNVLISSKVKTFQEAQQFGGLLILPMIGLISAQVTGIFMISTVLLLVVGIALFVCNGCLFVYIVRHNNRNALFYNQIH